MYELKALHLLLFFAIIFKKFNLLSLVSESNISHGKKDLFFESIIFFLCDAIIVINNNNNNNNNNNKVMYLKKREIVIINLVRLEKCKFIS
jgi:hypothetical protein